MTAFAPQQQRLAAPFEPPSIPSAQAIASRGRRPALIPHNTDLHMSLSAASAALSAATYSPSRERELDGVWVVPPPATPSLGSAARDGWDEGIGMSIDEATDIQGHAQHKVGEEFRKDVFNWVNAPTTDAAFVLPVKRIQNRSRDIAPETAPTSPKSGLDSALDRQKKRLEEVKNAVDA